MKKHVLTKLGSSPQFELKHVRRSLATTKPPLSSSASQSPPELQDAKTEIPSSTITSQTPSASVWVWRITPPEELERREVEIVTGRKMRTRPDPLKYDAATDRLALAGAPYIEHLNKRRQRTRLQKDQGERALVKEAVKTRMSMQQASSS